MNLEPMRRFCMTGIMKVPAPLRHLETNSSQRTPPIARNNSLMVANRHRAEARKAAFQPRPLAFAIALAFASQRAYALDPGALPSGGVVQGAIINWNTFNIGSSAQVNFHQPSVSSVALNRVNAGGGAS